MNNVDLDSLYAIDVSDEYGRFAEEVVYYNYDGTFSSHVVDQYGGDLRIPSEFEGELDIDWVFAALDYEMGRKLVLDMYAIKELVYILKDMVTHEQD